MRWPLRRRAVNAPRVEGLAEELQSTLQGVAEIIDNGVVRSAADDLRKTARRAHAIEIAIVAAAALALIAGVVIVANIGQTNKVGVKRIVDCTTPGRQCYEEQKARADVQVADALLRLNEEHLVIECFLKITPTPQARKAEEQRCRDEAAATTAKLQAELQQKIDAARREAVKNTKKAGQE